MRYLSLHLPFLATDRIRRRLVASAPPDTPPPDRPLATVAKVKSAIRLVALDARALALGLRPMLALADARAMHPRIDIHAADPEGDIRARDALLDWCRLFTPLAAPDDADGLMLDISGCAHLFGGEPALMDEVFARLARQGFAAKLAIADTPGAAWALARHGESRRLIAADLPPTALAKLFAPMPLTALHLDDRTIAQLGQAGLRRIGDLLLRPRAPIAARFGREIHHRLDVLLGRARDPISPRFEAPPFIAERRFAEGLTQQGDIEATIFALATDLCGLLSRHGEGARRLDLSLYRVDGVVKHIEVGTSRPLRDRRGMARLFHERIEAVGEEGLDTGYGFDVIRLAARSAERLDQNQTRFCEPDWANTSADASALADLVDRLGARFGRARVTRLATADSHQPKRAAVAVSAEMRPDGRSNTTSARQARSCGGHPRPAVATLSEFGSPCLGVDGRGKPGHDAESKEATAALPERPILLFDRPEPIETIAAVPDGPPLRFRWRRVMHHVAAIEGPERIGPDWWRQDTAATRDYFRAEDTDGRRFWLYREGLYRDAAEPRWFLHGLFA